MTKEKRSVAKVGIKIIPKHICEYCKKIIENQTYIEYRDGNGKALFIHNECTEKLKKDFIKRHTGIN